MLRHPPAARRKVEALSPGMPVPPDLASLLTESAIGSHAIRQAKITGLTVINRAHIGPKFISMEKKSDVPN
jgi:hypothetical protein